MLFWKKKKTVTDLKEVQVHLDGTLSDLTSRQIIGCRFCATGVYGYEFYEDGKKLCCVSDIVSPEENALITGFGKEWKSQFEKQTLFPGITRYVEDAVTEKKIFEISYWDSGEYEINQSIRVYCDVESYSFYCDEVLFAKIERWQQGSETNPSVWSEYQLEPWLDIRVAREVDEELLLAILAFPMLRFGL